MSATTYRDIPATLLRLQELITKLGYTCETITPGELFVFTATTYSPGGEPISIHINVTANGENKHLGEGNYIAFEVFSPCHIEDEQDEADLSLFIMQLIEEVDLTTIQYVPSTRQILVSRVDCITPQLPDKHIVDHILTPLINEFLHVFTLIESSLEENTPMTPVQPRYLN